MSIKLQKFDLSSIPDDATICMCAKRGSGKSFLIRDLMYHKRDFPAGMVLSPTDQMNQEYTSYIPSTFIHNEYRPEMLSNMFMRQRLMIDQNKERTAKGKSPRDLRAFLIMDDCLASKGEWGKDPNIANMFYNGRHYKILYIFSMQFPLGLKPEFRSNFDYVFLLSEDFLSNQKRYYEHYAGMIPSFDMFRQIFMEVTENYGALVINNKNKKSNKLTDKVFWYRAQEHGPFQVGGKHLKLFHRKHYDPTWIQRSQPFDIAAYLKKKNKCPQLEVELENEENDK